MKKRMISLMLSMIMLVSILPANIINANEAVTKYYGTYEEDYHRRIQ